MSGGANSRAFRVGGEAFRNFRPPVLVAVAFLVLAGRLFLFVHKNTVNILFSDQWDLYGPLFNHLSWWETFRWQHGPHRQGIGSVLIRILASYSHWNTRWDAFLVFGIVMLSALAALLLKVRLFGKLEGADVVIPCIFFTLMQYETFLGAVNPSHAAIPVLLLLLYCLGWLLNRTVIRYAVILTLDFLAIYTGFGVFVGVITPVLIGADVVAGLRKKDRPYLFHSTLALLLSLLLLGSFFVGYRNWPAADCVDAAQTNVSRYPQYAGLMLMNFFGWKRVNAVAIIFGVLLLLLLIGIATFRLLRVYRGKASNLDRAIVALIAFTSSFALTAAAGRVCLGLEQAQSSRYTLMVVPAILALYLCVLNMEKRRFRLPLLAVLGIACLQGALRLSSQDRQTAEWLVEGKRNWKACYLQLDNLEVCDARTGFKIYGGLPESTHLKEKLRFLQANRLNLFASEQ